MWVSRDAENFQMLAQLPRDIEIITYCAIGFRSGWLARSLTAQGFTNVSALKGGVYKWANEGREIYQFADDAENPEYNGTKPVKKLKVSIGRKLRTWSLLLLSRLISCGTTALIALPKCALVLTPFLEKVSQDANTPNL